MKIKKGMVNVFFNTIYPKQTPIKPPGQRDIERGMQAIKKFTVLDDHVQQHARSRKYNHPTQRQTT